jgi:putative transcriptional regulator
MEPTNLTNHFLIAMPGLNDINFSRSVTYICEHNQNGTLGITINRPADLRLDELLKQLHIEAATPDIANRTVYIGGPVQQDRGFILHSPNGVWDSSLRITDSISVTTSRDILNSIARGDGPDDCIIALGYSGWAPGQLESEMSANSWLSCPATEDILFHTPVEQRWDAAAKLLGIDLRLLSHDAGHA